MKNGPSSGVVECKKDGKRQRGRPPDPERFEKGRDASLVRLFTPNAVAAALVQRAGQGEDEKVELLLREFVLVKHRDGARRLARELADLVAEYPELESGEAPAPDRRAGYEVARVRVRAGLHEIEGMLNSQKVSAMAYREVAGVEQPPPGAPSPSEDYFRSAVDVVKHAAHDQRCIWDEVKADRDARFAGEDDD